MCQKGGVLPNKRLQLALPPIGVRPLTMLRGVLVGDGQHILLPLLG